MYLTVKGSDKEHSVRSAESSDWVKEVYIPASIDSSSNYLAMHAILNHCV